MIYFQRFFYDFFKDYQNLRRDYLFTSLQRKEAFTLQVRFISKPDFFECVSPSYKAYQPVNQELNKLYK